MCSVLQDSRNAKMTAAAPSAEADGVAQTHADRQTDKQTDAAAVDAVHQWGRGCCQERGAFLSSQPWKLGPGCKVGMSCMCYSLSCDAEENDSSCRCSQQCWS